MKKLLSPFLFILCGLLFAQEFQPFINSNNLWRVSRGISYGDGHYTFTEKEFRILNETVSFDGKNFHKVESRSREQIEYSSEYTEWTEWNTSDDFYIRENETEKKVYVFWNIYRQDNPPGEYLLYNFNLNLGDTIPLSGFEDFDDHPFPEQGLITSITYENVFGLENVKTFHTDLISTHGILKIYEGIGATTGLINITDVTDFTSHLEYFSNNLSVLDSNSDLFPSKIYPNPFTHQLQIDTNKQIQQLQLFDLEGNLIQTKANLNELKAQLGWLKSGVYILMISYENNSKETFKIIKK
jgi:hypothetical protein